MSREAASWVKRHPDATWVRSVPLVLLLTIPVGDLDAEPSTCAVRKPVEPKHANQLTVMLGDGISSDLLAAAVAEWQRCGGYGRAFPTLIEHDPADRTIAPDVIIRYVPRRRGRACAVRQGAVITLYRLAQTADGSPVHCQPRHLTVAHELGHYLGLADVGRAESTCGEHIMAPINIHNRRSRRVRAAECRAVDGLWVTAYEEATPGLNALRTDPDAARGRGAS